MAKRVLILGGGFGGLATATELRRLTGAGGPEIVVVDRRPAFFMGFRKIWALVGRAPLAEGSRPLDRLEAQGIRFVRAEVRAIDPAARRVETDAGPLEGDWLVVALGAEPRPDLVVGLAEHGVNLYDAAAAEAAAARVAGLGSGRVVVAVAGLPYKCPPAPYEAALLLDERFRALGVRERIELVFTTLQPALLPNAGPAGGRWIAEQFDRRGILHRAGWPVVRVEPGRVVYGEGTLECALALVVPPHRPPAVVQESGLARADDWVRADPWTLATDWPGVFAIGDVVQIPLANGTPLPKAGVFAEAEGLRVARAIAAELAGGPQPPPFDGRGACFLEVGGGEAALLEGEFFARPEPVVRVLDPDPERLEQKRRYEADRLAAWLGG